MSARVVETLSVRTRDALSLQASVYRVVSATNSDVVVLCHPHPREGGSMHLPVLESITDRCCAAGIAVVRFNFRGVGRSEGSWSSGVGEVSDVRATIEATVARFPTAVVTVGGWSFGGGISLRAVCDGAEPHAWFGLAPALQFAGTPPPCPPAAAFVIAGSDDSIVDSSATADWARGCGSDTKVEVIDHCDHFFVGRNAVRAGDLLAAWVGERSDSGQ